MSMQVFWGYTVLMLPVAVAVALILIFRWQARMTRMVEEPAEWLGTDSLLRLNRNCFECVHPVSMEALTGCLTGTRAFGSR
jgi:hypothetical protein